MPGRRGFFSQFWGAFGRVFPRCSTIAQAIAFNVFLAFFPTLLLAVAFASSWIGSRTALLDAIRDFTQFLPPGSQGIVIDFLSRESADIWKLALLGWFGCLFGGTQVMKLLMDGIHLIYGEEQQLGFLHRQFRDQHPVRARFQIDARAIFHFHCAVLQRLIGGHLKLGDGSSVTVDENQRVVS